MALSKEGAAGTGLASVIFCLVIPAVSVFGISVWLGEIFRLRRASFYLLHLEKSMELTWESWLRENPNRIFVGNHRATYIGFGLAGFGSFLCGLYLFPWSSIACKTTLYGFVALAGVLLIVGIVLLSRGWTRVRELEKGSFFWPGPVMVPNRVKYTCPNCGSNV
jgi:hypothetical protein